MAQSPTIIINSTQSVICEGDSLLLSLQFTGQGPLSFQWSTGSSAQSITVSPITDSYYSCTLTDGISQTAADTLFILVHERPVLQTIQNIGFCSDSAVQLGPFSSSVPGASFHWTNSNPAVGIGNSGTGAQIQWNAPTIFPNQTILSTFCVYASYNGCSSDTSCAILSINEPPQLNPISNLVFCPGESIPGTILSSSIPTASYNWSNQNTAIGLPASGTGNIPSFISSSNTGTYINSTITFQASNNGCNSAILTATYTLKPSPNAALNGTGSTLINGNSFFRLCEDNFAGTIDILNQSTSSYPLLSNTIQWGDGTSFSSPSFISTSHVYDPGLFTLEFTSTNNLNCTDTAIYQIYVGSNPAVNLGYTGSTNICAPSSIEFNILGVQSNTPGTTYQITFSDGSDTIFFSHPPPTSFLKYFTGNSCGNSVTLGTNTIQNAFAAYIEAYNYCPDHSYGAVGPIKVSEKPDSEIQIEPDSSICQNDTVLIINNTDLYYQVTPTGCDSTVHFFWQITPGTGWNLVSGSLGNSYGLLNQNLWFTGSDSLDVTFSEPGTYIISLINANYCGKDTAYRTITVNPIPDIEDNLVDISVCPGELIDISTFTSNPGNAVFSWSNSNTAIGLGAGGSGNIASWIAPQNISGNSISGTIHILAALGACTDTANFDLTISPKPLFLGILNDTVCSGESFDFGGISISPASSAVHWIAIQNQLSIPSSGVGIPPNWVAENNTSNQPISATIWLYAENNSCKDSISLIICINPTPKITVIQNQEHCPGESVSIPTFSSTPAGSSFSWTNSMTAIGLSASGAGNIGSWTAPDNATGAILSGEISVTSNLDGCNDTSSFFINLKPRPILAEINDLAVCPGTSLTIPTFTSNPAGALFAWTNDDSSIGLGTSGSGNILPWNAPANLTGASFHGAIAVISSLNACQDTMDFTITVKPTPQLLPVGDLSVCPADNILIPAFQSTPGGSVFAWSNSNTAVGLPASGSGTIASFAAPGNPSGSSLQANICVTPSLNGCPGPDSCFQLEVKPSPILAAMSNVSVCAGEAIMIPAFSSTPAAGAFSWENSNTAIGLPASGVGDIATWNAPANLSGTALSSTVLAIANLNACLDSVSFQISVKPTPLLGNLADQEYCPGEAINNIQFSSLPAGAGFAWTSSNLAIPYSASGSGQLPLIQAPSNYSGANLQTSICVSPLLNSCPGAESCFSIAVKPTPQITAVANQTVCPGEAIVIQPFSSTPAGSSFSWTNSSTAIGLSVSGAGNIGSWTASDNATGAILSGEISVTSNLDGCNDTSSFFINLKPRPILAEINDLAVCPGTSLTIPAFTSNPAGALFTWTNDDSSIGLGASGSGNILPWNAPANLTGTSFQGAIAVISTLNACQDTMDFTITVKPTPQLLPVGDLSVCPADNILIPAFQSTPGGSGFTWSNSNTAIGLPASGSGTIASFAAPGNPSGSSLQASICVTPSLNGCPGPDSCFQLEVKPSPILAAMSNVSVCAGEAIMIPAFSSTPAAGAFSWENSNTAIGLPASGVGDIATWNAPANLSGTALSSTVLAIANLNACLDSVSFQISVKPTPVLGNLADPQYCPGEAINNIQFSSLPAGAGFAWTSSNLAIPYPSSGSGQLPLILAPSNYSGANLQTSICVSPLLNGCDGPDSCFTIAVKPTPQITAVASQTLCPGESVSIQAFSSTPAGSSFSWTNSSTAIGLSVSGAGNIGSWTAPDNATGAILSGEISVTSNLDGCNDTSSFFINLKPRPILAEISDLAVCPGTSLTIPAFTSNPAGALFAWTNDDSSIGLGTSGSGNILPWNAPANLTGASFQGAIAVISTLNACQDTMDFTITVKPTPQLLPVGDLSVCPADNILIPAFQSMPGGSSFTWSNSNTAIGLPLSGSGSIAGFTAPGNPSGSSLQASICVTPSLNGCPGPDSCFQLEVKPSPVLAAMSNVSVCAGEAIILPAFSSTPAAGAFSWENSNTAIGLPASGAGDIASWNAPANLSGTALSSTVLAIANLNACLDSVSFQISVKPTPVLGNLADQQYCPGEAINNIQFSSLPAGAGFAWTSSNLAIPYPSSGSGQLPLLQAPSNYSGANLQTSICVSPLLNGCDGPDSCFSIAVKPTPQITAVSSQTLCPGESLSIPAFSSTPAGSFFSWTNSSTAIGLPGSGAGNIGSWTAPDNATGAILSGEINITSNLDGCNDTSSFFINLKPRPILQEISDLAVCPGTSLTIPAFTSNPAGALFAWTNDDSSIGLGTSGSGNILPWNAPANLTGTSFQGAIAVISTLNACQDTMDFTITVKPTPQLLPVGDLSVCPADNILIPAFQSTPGGSSFAWSNSNTAIGLPASGSGTIAGFSAPGNPSGSSLQASICVTPSLNGCPGPDSCFQLEVKPSPILAAMSNVSVCAGEAIILPAFNSIPAAGAFSWENSNTAIGLPASGAGDIASWNAPANLSGTALSSTVLAIANLNACLDSVSFQISVKPTPVLSVMNDISFCPDENITIPTFTTNIAGATFLWNNSTTDIGLPSTGSGQIGIFQSAINYTSTPISSTIQVISSFNNCSDTTTFELNLKPAPQITSSLIEEECSGQPFNYFITSNLSGTTYSWTRPAVFGLNPQGGSGTGSGISETIVSLFSTPLTTIYYLEAIAPGPTFCNSDSVELSLTVLPAPMIINSLSENICSGEAFSLLIICNVLNAGFNWTRSIIPGINNPGSGGFGVNGDIITETLTNTTNQTIAVPYTISPFYMSGDTCPGIESTLTVYVNPTPVLDTDPDLSICSGHEILLPLGSNVPGGNFTWTRPSIPGVSNPASSGEGSSISEVLFNQSDQVIQVPYFITPYGPGDTYCMGNPANYFVDVYPLPKITSPSRDTVCSGSEFSFQPEANMANVSYQWERLLNNNLLPPSNQGFSDTIQETIENLTPYPMYATYTIRPFLEDIIGCEGESSQLELLIDAPILVEIGPDTCLKEDEMLYLDADNPDANFLWSTGETTQTIYYSDWVNNPMVSVEVSHNKCPTIFDSLIIDKCSLIDVPNAFSPNGDGVNDQLCVEGIGVKEIDFRIYNRWGEEVFRSNDIRECWTGINQAIEVYFYRLAGQYENGDYFYKEGNITLLR